MIFFIFFALISANYGVHTVKGKLLIGMLGIFYTLGIYGFVTATDLFKESYSYQTSPGKLCRGGPYMWQGDSEQAKLCRKLASTPEGQAEIQRYSCGAGYSGMPACRFKDTPMSNGNWTNKRCTCLSDDVDENSFLGCDC